MNPAAKPPPDNLVNHRRPVSRACKSIVTVVHGQPGSGKSGVACSARTRSKSARTQGAAFLPFCRPQTGHRTGVAHCFAAAASRCVADFWRCVRELPLSDCHVCVGWVQQIAATVTPPLAGAAPQRATCACKCAPVSPALVRSHLARRCGRPASPPPRRRCTRRRRCCA
jgi:hypothetical protein